jgi:hypothetical protein
LGERLVNDGLISSQALHEIHTSLGDATSSETRTALALMDFGYISRDELRTWAIQKAVDVLRVILIWSAGDVYFEEGTPPPADRLLVSMSVISIIDSIPQVSQSDRASLFRSNQSAQPRLTKPLQSAQSPKSTSASLLAHQKLTANAAQVPINRARTDMGAARKSSYIPPSTPKPDVANVPTLMGFGQFFGDIASSASSVTDALSVDALPLTESLLPIFPKSDAVIGLSSVQEEDNTGDISFASLFSTDNSSAATPSILAVRAMNPVPPKRIDTSFMQPDMVLTPADLSSFREQNPQFQVTPDQWRLLTCADGQTTLKTAYQKLAMSPELLCQIAGELMAEHLLHVSLPEQTHVSEISPVPQERVTSGKLSNGYVAPAYAAVAARSSSSSTTASDGQLKLSSSHPFETESQWGNGGNGATFVPGRGWITAPQPLRPLQSSGPLASSAYMQVGSATH